MKLIILLISIFCISSSTGFSQTDTIYIIKTDTVFVSEKKDIMYKMFVENREAEIRHLWKMNFVDMGLVRPNIAFEQRIFKSFSIESYISLGLKGNLYQKNEIFNGTRGSTFEFEQQVKYYYNIKRREHLGKKTNGFTGNNISLSFWYNENYDPTWKVQGNQYLEPKNYNLGLKHSIQHRIGNIGYLEFYMAVYYRWGTKHEQLLDLIFKTYDINPSIVPVVGIRAGFAIDTKKNLKKAFKN